MPSFVMNGCVCVEKIECPGCRFILGCPGCRTKIVSRIAVALHCVPPYCIAVQRHRTNCNIMRAVPQGCRATRQSHQMPISANPVTICIVPIAESQLFKLKLTPLLDLFSKLGPPPSISLYASHLFYKRRNELSQ